MSDERHPPVESHEEIFEGPDEQPPVHSNEQGELVGVSATPGGGTKRAMRQVSSPAAKLSPGRGPHIEALEIPGMDLAHRKATKERLNKAPDVVSFENVSKVFPTPDGGECVAIKNVSFTVPDLPDVGEFVAILGPSGCGKSTVLSLIAGLEPSFPPTTGVVKTRGQVVTKPGPDRGMVFQSYSSFPAYTVLENVAFGLMLQGVPREEREDRAAEWIKKVRLAGSEHKYPHQLSGGMRQRVAIARSLVLHPRIILMDEPYGALDRVTRWEMQDLLVELWEEVQATVFLVTHDIAEAVYLGDRIFLFSSPPGTLAEIVELGPPSGNAAKTQRTPEFNEIVNHISFKVEKAS